jgi:hypothetical protein
MRLVRRAVDTKTSVIRREAVSSVNDAVGMNAAWPSSASPFADQGDVTRDVTLDSARARPPFSNKPEPVLEEPEGSFDERDELEDSDVFLSKTYETGGVPVLREVTLFVHGWENVEPGLLSWTFPSLRSALDAVQRMKNAIAWCVVSGTGWEDLETARASGSVLVEQLA